MAHWKSGRWFLSLQVALHVVLVFVHGAEDSDEAYRNGRSLVSENFLPINFPGPSVEAPTGREKREVEGSGEGEGPVFGDVKDKSVDGDDADNSTENALLRLFEDGDKPRRNGTEVEGSGDSASEEEDKDDARSVPIIAEELTTTTEPESTSEEASEVEDSSTTEMIFDRSEDFTEETTTIGDEPGPWTENATEVGTTSAESTTEEPRTTTPTESVADEYTSRVPAEEPEVEGETTAVETTTAAVETTPEATDEPITVAVPTGAPGTEEPATAEVPRVTSEKVPPEATPTSTEVVPVTPAPVPTTPIPVVEEVFKEVKTPLRNLEASPGNILRKENLSLGADPQLIVTNTRVMDAEEGSGSSEPKRLGAYIVIGLILLSFSSLVGYITFRKRMSRKRLEFENSPESNDTEKALLSLSDYKDHSELEENHLKNNEITPIVVKSNSQMNKFEKNTNFSSPKNLNTTANEKNIEKDNVLKSTAENLTQVIIEDSPKDVEEDKNAPGMERLIVKTRVDQDSIPKKPVIVTRTPGGYMPIPQDNSSI